MVDKFTDQQIEELRDVYTRVFDRDHDGRLSKKDLDGGLRTLGVVPQGKDVDDILFELNSSRLGVLDLAEFLTGMSRTLGNPDEEAEYLEAFRLYDPKGTGFITSEQLTMTLSLLGENVEKEEVAELIKEADVDNDGKISFSEFKRMVNRKV
jgi:calmodulin